MQDILSEIKSSVREIAQGENLHSIPGPRTYHVDTTHQGRERQN